MTKSELLKEIIQGNELKNLKIDFDIYLDEISIENNSIIDKKIVFKNCDLQIFDACCIEFLEIFEFENCTFKSLRLHGIILGNGFKLSNCKIHSFFDFSCAIVFSGKNEIYIEDNFFEDVVTFEDTTFKDKLILIGNQFIIGCDLETKKQLGCHFPSESLILNNLGTLSLTQNEENNHWKRIRNIENSREK